MIYKKISPVAVVLIIISKRNLEDKKIKIKLTTTKQQLSAIIYS